MTLFIDNINQKWIQWDSESVDSFKFEERATREESTGSHRDTSIDFSVAYELTECETQVRVQQCSK